MKANKIYAKIYGKHKYSACKELICRVEFIQPTSEMIAEFIRNFYANFQANYSYMIEQKEPFEKYENAYKYGKK